MADPTNEELAERLEDMAGATPRRDTFSKTDTETCRLAAARLRQPLAFRWDGRDLYIGRRWRLGSVIPPIINVKTWTASSVLSEEMLRGFDTEAEANAALEAHITAQVTGGGA